MKTIVTDIEGTTSSIAFVKDVLFPHARRELLAFVQERGGDPDVRRWLDQVEIPDDGSARSDARVVAQFLAFMDVDRKDTALKAIQGMIWKRGFEAGVYRSHVYADATEALVRWSSAGHRLCVYSSGSVEAQRLLFGHTTFGDMTPLFSGYFDTAAGAKRAPSSYRTIMAALGAPSDQLMFLSDAVEELDAAREAGWSTVLVDRREDHESPRLGEAAHGHARVTSFAEIAVGVTRSQASPS